MRRVSRVLFLIVAVFMAHTVSAQQPNDYQERLGLVRELIELQGGRPNLEPMIDLMLKQMRDAIVTKSPERRAEIDATVADKLKPIMVKSLPAFNAEIDRIYAEVYDYDDLKAAVSFLHSDEGKIFIDRQRRVAVKLQEATGIWSQNLMRNLLTSLEQK